MPLLENSLSHEEETKDKKVWLCYEREKRSWEWELGTWVNSGILSFMDDSLQALKFLICCYSKQES